VAENMQGKAFFGSVVDADTLCINLANPAWRIIDCRHDLARPEAGREAYRAGHLTGAVFAHLDQDLSGPRNGVNGRHPLPSSEQVADRFRRWGIEKETQIVAYDAGNGMFAGRLWWLARWIGHLRVALLDGGFQAGLKAGIPLETGSPSYVPTRLEPGSARMPTVSAAQVDSLRADPSWVLVDARAPDRFEGRNETIDPVAGHIPGAVNRFWQDNLQPDGQFKSPEQLRREFDALLAGRPASRLIAQCGSGVTACHHLVAMERAGLGGASLFPGSWSEWISDPTRPVAAGIGA
jgi:thiosulfate/3-mercaptopyruvate sulfurtransferase